MAIGYGDEHSYTQNGYTLKWKALVDYAVTSETEKAVNYSVSVKVLHVGTDASKHVTLAAGITASLTVDGTEVATVTTPSSHELYATEEKAWEIISYNGTFNKTHGTSLLSPNSQPKKKALTATIKLNNWGKATSTYTNEEAFVVQPTTHYTVTYNGNGATLFPTSTTQIKWHDESLTLKTGNGVRRTNYEFTGWNTAADGSGTAYASGASYTANANVTLYAQWKLATIPVKVKVGGAWKTGIVQSKVSGAWKTPFVGYIKVNGTWKQIM